MADVVQKVINANNIEQGNAITMVTKLGTIHSISPVDTDAISIAAVETKYTSRFDDPNYYTHSG